MLGGRLRTLHTSPLPRCVQTAEALRSGAGVDVPIVSDRLLGDPGVYVVDGRSASSCWRERGHEAVMRSLATGSAVLPGMADPNPAARLLLRHMLATAGSRPGLHLFITHDFVVTTTVSRLLGEPLGPEDWPWYLEGAFFHHTAGCVSTAYRDRSGRQPAAGLVCLDEREIIDFARREVAMTFGLTCDARFYVAGGAFKTLLTGLPPRDLDLWAPSAQDRETVRAALASAACRHTDGQFADVFEISGRTIELARKIASDALEERLCRFDLALSAVGAEHCPGDQWRAVVHPLARKATELGQILLLKPLVNWSYALVTLERARRYAEELGYVFPAEEEAEVWRVFDPQPCEMKAQMLCRYDQAARGSHGVRDEALRRFR